MKLSHEQRLQIWKEKQRIEYIASFRKDIDRIVRSIDNFMYGNSSKSSYKKNRSF